MYVFVSVVGDERSRKEPLEQIVNSYSEHLLITSGECSRHTQHWPFLFDISSPLKSFLQEETDPFHKFPRVEPHDCVEVIVR
jgi:hypothetical protein